MNQQKTDIELGDTVRDTITGFSGVVVCRSAWLNGCVRISVQSKKLNSGKPVDPETFDVEQVELVSKRRQPEHKPNGGPRPAPVRQRLRNAWGR